jgi:uncharacterized protein
MLHFIRSLIGTLLLLAGAATLCAQPQVTSEMVSLQSTALRGTGTAVKGELRLPQTGADRLPAVLVLHSSAGYDGERASYEYIERLNREGIATFRIHMFSKARGRPRSTRDVLPHAYGGLLYLAAHPRIDPQRIGVIGFSYGGVMSVLSSSQELTQEYAGGKARFAAHIALYPVCSAHLQILGGSNRVYAASVYQHVTGAPVHILSGELDSYDDPDSCPKFVAALPDGVREHYAATVYPGAYHVFDEPGANRSHRDRYARGNGIVVVRYSAQAADKAYSFAALFFAQHLAAGK